MLDVIRGGEPLRQALVASLDKIRADDTVARIPLADVRWHPPVRHPGKICAVAMNNSASNERKISAPDHPAFFLKPASCLVGHREPIRIRPLLRQRASGARARARHRPRDARRAGDAARSTPYSATRSSTTSRATACAPKTGSTTGPCTRRRSNPNETERVEQHLSYAGPLQGHRHVRRDGPVARDEGRDREPRRSHACNARSAARSSPRTARATTTTRWPRS